MPHKSKGVKKKYVHLVTFLVPNGSYLQRQFITKEIIPTAHEWNIWSNSVFQGPSKDWALLNIMTLSFIPLKAKKK